MTTINTYKYLELYKSFGLNVFLGRYMSKKPGIDWLRFKYEKADETIQLLLLEKNNNVFVMTGETSDNLVVIDVDDAKYFENKIKNSPNCKDYLQLLDECYYYRGENGRKHYVFYTNYDLSDIDKDYTSRGVLQGPDTNYTLLYRACTPFPGSKHPKGEDYKWNKDNPVIPMIGYYFFENILKDLFELPVSKPSKIEYNFKKQTTINMDTASAIYDVIKDYYVEGTRNIWWLGLSGELCRRNMFYECNELMELLKDKDGRDYPSRKVTFQNTVMRIKNNQPVAGLNYIGRITKDMRVINKLREILNK